ncbi:LuxR C-terminal-related transcriptional regulator [Streptomyces krungchingensis]|uniref:helix-turn-helix transcriptional regulator n=1 Tax=Streptomyces krungchingensis TaxID=1565034 RepID=UPI003CF0EB57
MGLNADDPAAMSHHARDGQRGRPDQAEEIPSASECDGAASAETAPMLSVAVVAEDQLTYEGATAALAAFPHIRVLPRGDEREADVLVAFADNVSDQALKHVQQISARQQDARAVLVTDSITEPRLIRAISLGVVSVVLRTTATFSEIADAAVAASIGNSDVPPHVLGPLIRHMRRMERHGSRIGAGLSSRDMTVLSLLSDGLDTAQIARRLSYSERTIKSIVHAIINTLGVSNRTHAVAYMIRAGFL